MADHDDPITPKIDDVSRKQPQREIAWWRVAVLGAVALIIALSLMGLVYLTAKALALLFIAIVIAEAVAPAIRLLERLMPRGMAVFALYLIVLGVIAGSIWLLVPRLVAQGEELMEEAPSVIERGERWLSDTGITDDTAVLDSLQSNLDRFGGVLVDVPLTVATSVTQIVLVFFMSAYWLITKPHLRAFVQSLVPTDQRDEMDETLGALGSTVGGYIRGEMIAGAIIGVLTYIGLTVLGVRYALVLAIISAIGELIPVIGPIISAVPAVLVGLLESPTQALIVAGFYLILQQVESNLIIPNVMNTQADIPPLLVIVALFAGGGIGGILGALVAIPLAGAMKVIVVRIVAPAIRRWTGAADRNPDQSSGDAGRAAAG